MEVKEIFRKHCQRINFIFILAKQNFQYCYYMHKPDTQEELEYTQKDRHLRFIRHSLWRITILEIAKLYNKSKHDKYNLIQFINELKPTGIFSEMKVDESVIKEWERIIKVEKSLIKIIVDLRNKIYAHTDEELGELTNKDIYFKDLERLIEFTESFMKKIYHDVLDATLDLRTPTFDRGKRFDWIKILAEEHRKSLEKYFRTVEG